MHRQFAIDRLRKQDMEGPAVGGRNWGLECVEGENVNIQDDNVQVASTASVRVVFVMIDVGCFGPNSVGST